MVMDKTLPLANVKAHLSEIVDGVESGHDRVILTRNGRPAAVILSPGDLEALPARRPGGDTAGARRTRFRPLSDRGRTASTFLQVLAAQLGETPIVAGYTLRVAPSAARALERLPQGVAAAVVEFLTGPLLQDPRRVGKPLVRQLAEYWSARRGAYRVVYAIEDATAGTKGLVLVVRIEHRADVYRPL
jgi:mRNA interferase RelE/StbE